MVDCRRGTHNPFVPGSSPGGPTIFFNSLRIILSSLKFARAKLRPLKFFKIMAFA